MKQQYIIEKANIGDLPRIEAIYAAARAFMASHGNPNQWGNGNPPSSQLMEDILGGNLYVLRGNGVIRGVFAFFLGEDPTYLRIYGGEWHSAAPYGTIHRVAGDGSGGIFAACAAFCREKCGYLRIDTHRDNLPMQRAVEREGFRRCGTIRIGDGSERVAFDWIQS